MAYPNERSHPGTPPKKPKPHPWWLRFLGFVFPISKYYEIHNQIELADDGSAWVKEFVEATEPDKSAIKPIFVGSGGLWFDLNKAKLLRPANKHCVFKQLFLLPSGKMFHQISMGGTVYKSQPKDIIDAFGHDYPLGVKLEFDLKKEVA